MWVVLTDPARKDRWTEAEFFFTGRVQVDEMMNRLRTAGISPMAGHALDFGCGVGRLTQALAAHFESVDGVDISASMIRCAEKFNRFPERVKYHLNVRSDLAAFPPASCDFICSVISLQHTPRRFQVRYLADFLRLLKPGGAAYFQTIHARGWRQFVPEWAADCVRKWRNRGRPFIPLYAVPARQVRRIFDPPGSGIVKFESVRYAGWESRYASDLYFVRKNASAG